MWRKIVIPIDYIVDTTAARSATRNTQEYATPSLNSLYLYTKCSSCCRNVLAPMADAPEVRPSEGDLEVLYIYEQPTQRNDSYRPEIPFVHNRADEDCRHWVTFRIHRQAFWLLIVLVAIVITVAIGGSVAGVLITQRTKYVLYLLY